MSQKYIIESVTKKIPRIITTGFLYSGKTSHYNKQNYIQNEVVSPFSQMIYIIERNMFCDR